MGYCYQGRKLCCDICGEAGAKKYPYPFGYCPQAAACPKCRKEHAEHFGRAKHREHGCEVAHNRFVQRENERRQLLADGKLLRCAAVSEGHGVKVWFKSAASEVVKYMATETYHAYPLGENVTLEQYQAAGIVVDSLEALPQAAIAS